MKKTIYLILILLVACGKKYQEIQEADLEAFTSISEVWRDREGNRLLYAYTDDDEEVEPVSDWIYEKNHDAAKRYFLINRSNGFNPPLQVGFHKDSLILLHESESESFSEWWIEVKEKHQETTASADEEAEFAYPDKAVTKKFAKDYLNTLSGGVFKLEGDTLVQVCNYQKYKDWTGIAALGTGVYYFAKPGNFYKYQITLHQIE